MVDQLSSFADEVTRVAREVAPRAPRWPAQVRGVSAAGGAPENVNFMANNLTTQVRNMPRDDGGGHGELSRKITVEARGDILEQSHHQHHGGPMRSFATR